MTGEAAPDSQYWLCVALNENAQLIHGCLVCHAEPWAILPSELRHSEIELDGSKLLIVQALLDRDSASEIALKLETQFSLDLSGHNGPTISMSGQRHRLLDGFGKSANATITYSAKDFPDLPDSVWMAAIESLNSLFGEDFRKHPDRLGTFLVFGDIQASDISTPVSFEVERDEDADLTVHPTCFTLISHENLDGAITVLVELFISNELAYTALFTLGGQTNQTVDAVPFDEYRVSVFNKSGELVFREGYALMLTMGFNLSAVGQTYSLNDGLANSAKGLGKNVLAKAKTVSPRSTTRSLVGVSNVAFDVHFSKAKSVMHRLAPDSLGDRWFPRGIASEVDVIQHLNTMLDGGRVSSAVIVDPFFGIETLKRVIARLESLDVKLTVVMSLSVIDPETNQEKEDIVTDLRKMLAELRRHPQQSAIATLRVVNLTDGGKQAFHDRYLLLSPYDGEREVYLLSNSLNRMAGNWPFCISKLDPAAARDAARYIDGLVQGRDISGSTQPVITFQWPDHENG